MSYATLSGPASHVSRGSESTEFRVGRQPVWIMATPHLANGDFVSVVGYERNGTVRAVVMRNDTTGLVSHRHLPFEVIQASTPAFVFAALALGAIVLSGGLGLFFLLPLVFPAAGFLLFLRYRRGQEDRAKAVLREMPVPQLSP